MAWHIHESTHKCCLMARLEGEIWCGSCDSGWGMACSIWLHSLTNTWPLILLSCMQYNAISECDILGVWFIWYRNIGYIIYHIFVPCKFSRNVVLLWYEMQTYTSAQSFAIAITSIWSEIEIHVFPKYLVACKIGVELINTMCNLLWTYWCINDIIITVLLVFLLLMILCKETIHAENVWCNISEVFCQKQVTMAGTSNYITQYMCDVITCLCPWYPLLAKHSWYVTVCKIYDIWWTEKCCERHNTKYITVHEHCDISNNQQLNSLFNSLFLVQINNKNNPPQRAIKVESVSMSGHHHV